MKIDLNKLWVVVPPTLNRDRPNFDMPEEAWTIHGEAEVDAEQQHELMQAFVRSGYYRYKTDEKHEVQPLLERIFDIIIGKTHQLNELLQSEPDPAPDPLPEKDD